MKRKVIKAAVLCAALLLVADLIYKTVNNITYMTREKCFVYRSLPRVYFLILEYFIELGIVVFVGIFLATFLAKYFSKYQSLYPKNVITAFLYASLLPVCACAVIPFLGTMKGKLKFRVLMTFVVAAPLLSPYIVILSFLILGVKYGILRIACSCVLAVSAGYILELFYDDEQDKVKSSELRVCDQKICPILGTDIYADTYRILLMVLPYLVIAGICGIAFELLTPKDVLLRLNIGNNPLGIIAAIAVGAPLYLCNGAEVFFLRPLLAHGGFSLGTAMAFSLTSTAICITSLVMLLKFLGKKLTFILLAHVVIVTFIMSYLVNLLL